MDRDEFMELVYETFADEPDNVLANGIIEAADAYVEYEKAQLFLEGTTSDLISRQPAIDALDKQIKQCCKALGSLSLSDADKHAVEVKMASLRAHREMLQNLPTVQPEPQEGHWIDKGWNGDWAWQTDGRGNCWRVIECSECGKSVLVESNYCPHCGARMKGERQK